jgi:hypothetical protein
MMPRNNPETDIPYEEKIKIQATTLFKVASGMTLITIKSGSTIPPTNTSTNPIKINLIGRVILPTGTTNTP